MTLDRDLVVAALPAYEVGGELGRGGWGIVLAGKHRQLGREVAIKQLPRAFAADPQVRARFLSEARVLASFDHPHIVPVYDYVERDGLCLLVMEMLPGGTVWSRFTAAGLTMDSACAVVLAACDALQCAHAQGVLHRDIKPENLMFTAGSVLKVTDFGIAKVIGGPQTLATRAGEVLGTPAYMAPEQAQAAELTPATDVYAAGTMLYELLSGRLPFRDDGDALALLYRHVHERPTPLSEVAPDVPGAIADVVMRAITTDPAARFRSAESFGVALAEAATAAWGPGWLGRGDVRVMASSSIVAATERASDVPAAGATVHERPVGPAPRTEAASPAQVPAPATQAATAAAPAAGPTELVPPVPTTEPEPAPATAASAVPGERVKPSVRAHATGPAIGDNDELDLVPVHEVLRPPPPTAHLLAALVLMVLAVAIAFAGGSPAHDRRLDRAVAVNGIELTPGNEVELDLSQPVEIAGAPAPGVPPPSDVLLRFSVLGLPLGSASAPAAPADDGSFTASVDASGSRYFVAGQVTGEVELRDGTGLVVGTASFPATSQQSAFLTVPGVVGIALLLFVLAYAESLLRSRRRGKKGITATVGLMVVGALAGMAAVVMAWLVASREPVETTLVICALLGAGAGLATALAAGRMGKRKRISPKAPSSRRTM